MTTPTSSLLNSDACLSDQAPSSQSNSAQEHGAKREHSMLAPFTAGWQTANSPPLVMERSELTHAPSSCWSPAQGPSSGSRNSVYSPRAFSTHDWIMTIVCTSTEWYEGCYVYDSNGNKYLDALAGLLSTALGGSEPRLVKAAAEQLNKLPFYHSFWNYTTKPSLDLAKELISMFTASEMRKVLFTCSGSEANESQVKLVWYYNNALGRPKKKKIIARSQSYHGTTFIAASLSGLPTLHQDFDLPGHFVLHTDCPHYWRFHLPGETEEEFSTRLANNLDNLILKEGPDTIAAFIAEPAIGAGGVIPPPETYFEKIQAVLKKHDILFIVDEVITGFGRLGTMFGSDLYNIKPDLVSLAKALSSAYAPIGAILVSPEISDVIHSHSNKLGTFAHGFTYSGHPVSCAVALEALKIYRERDIPGHVTHVAQRFQEGIKAFASGSPIVGETRGVGLLIATEFTDNKSPYELFPFEWGVGEIFGAECKKRGMIVKVLGNLVAMSPPLIITHEEIDEVVRIYGEALKATEERVALLKSKKN